MDTRDTDSNHPDSHHVESKHSTAMGESQERGMLKLAPIEHDEYDALADLFLGDGELAPPPIESDVGNEQEVEQQAKHQSVEESLEDHQDDEKATHEESVDTSGPSHSTHSPVLILTRHEDDAALDAVEKNGKRAEELLAQLGSQLDEENSETLDSLKFKMNKFNRESSNTSHEMSQWDDEWVDDSWNETDEHDWDEEFEYQTQAQSRQEDSYLESDEEWDDVAELLVMPRPKIEVVVLGHLPIRASLWARQYACTRAQELDETIALVRSASGSTSVDLISSGEAVKSQTYAHVESAIQAVSDLADRVLFRVDEGREPELLERAEVEEITVLTGADEAAVVASYRLMKTIDASLNEQSTSEDGPMLRLAVMGAKSEQAQDACTKLRNAVVTFLKRPIEIVTGSSRIDAMGTTNIFRDSHVHRAGAVLDSLVECARLDLIHEMNHCESEEDLLKLISDEPVEASDFVEFDDFEDESTADTGIESDSMEDPASELEVKPTRMGQDDECQVQHQETVTGSIPETISEYGATQDSSEHHSSMKQGLSSVIQGLSPIETRCPKAQGVEFAIDQEGQLHVVACDLDLAMGVQDAVNRLLAAQNWASNNFSLLLRAEPGLSIPQDPRAELKPAMHLLTSQPRSVRELYDTDVHVYSLVRVRIAGHDVEVATPIN